MSHDFEELIIVFNLVNIAFFNKFFNGSHRSFTEPLFQDHFNGIKSLIDSHPQLPAEHCNYFVDFALEFFKQTFPDTDAVFLDCPGVAFGEISFHLHQNVIFLTPLLSIQASQSHYSMITMKLGNAIGAENATFFANTAPATARDFFGAGAVVAMLYAVGLGVWAKPEIIWLGLFAVVVLLVAVVYQFYLSSRFWRRSVFGDGESTNPSSGDGTDGEAG